MLFDLVCFGGDAIIDGSRRRANVGIREGRIAAITTEPIRGAQEIDCTGVVVLPGCIDTHVHFREPGRTDKEDFGTGTRAAAAGGITTVLEIQNNEPLTTSADAAREKLAMIAPKSRVNFGIYGNVGVQNLDQLGSMCESVIAFKAFMTQSVGPLTITDIGDLAKAFRAVAKIGRVLAVHAESDGINKLARQGLPDMASSHVLARPALSEAVAVGEAIEMARAFGTRLHLPHLSTARAVTLVERAKADGLDITAATCPQYLFFTDDDVAAVGNWLKINPSIKSKADQDGLIDGIRRGVIDHVHSDHAPHTTAEKSQNFGAAPSGLPGIQHQVPVLLDLCARGLLTLLDVARLMGEAPARAFGLAERGAIRVGYHGDLTVVDPGAVQSPAVDELFSKTGHSPYVGRRLQGRVLATVVGGRMIFRDGRIVDDSVRGVRVESAG